MKFTNDKQRIMALAIVTFSLLAIAATYKAVMFDENNYCNQAVRFLQTIRCVNATGLMVNNIAEYTAASGVTIDGVLLKDNNATVTNINTTTLTASDAISASTYNGSGASLTGLTKSQVGLGSVENTALSTWSGTQSLAIGGEMSVSSVSASGDVTASEFRGGGANITGLTKSQVGLTSVEDTAISTWPGSQALTTGGDMSVTSITASGDITATAFHGDGSALTGIGGGGVVAPVTITSGTTLVDSSYSGKTITNAGAVTDVTLQLDTLANLGNAFSVGVVNETGAPPAAAAQLVLHMDGAEGGAVFTDSSAAPHTITVTNAVTKTGTKIYGSGAGFFDGTGDYLQSADSADWDLDTNNFTIHFWYRPAIVTAYDTFVGQWGAVPDSDNLVKIDIGNHPTAGIRFQAISAASAKASYAAETQSWNSGQWYHIAVVRNGTSLAIYRDGVSLPLTVTTAISTNELPNLDGLLVIGQDAVAGGRDISGRLDEVVWVNGTALWTADFVPPTGPYQAAGGRIILKPASGEQLPGTTAADRTLVSTAQWDSIKLRSTDTGQILESAYPKAANWVDSAP